MGRLAPMHNIRYPPGRKKRKKEESRILIELLEERLLSQSLTNNTPLLRVLAGETLSTSPIWLMRQAGRYLPEYRDIRAGAGSFLELCYNPELAAKVTLQPIERFGLDAAILFSDILVIPDALGQRVEFREGEGPVLEPITDREAFSGSTARAFLTIWNRCSRRCGACAHSFHRKLRSSAFAARPGPWLPI